MNQPRILVAGVGNIFLGDDAFGVEVVTRLRQRRLPASVQVVDFGIRGLDLAYTLLDDYEACLLIDAAPRGGTPGDLYVIETDTAQADGENPAAQPVFDGHRLEPAKVLEWARAMGGKTRRILVVGCEPTPLDPDADIQPELSDAVRAILPHAVDLVVHLVDELLDASPRTHDLAQLGPAADTRISAGPSNVNKE